MLSPLSARKAEKLGYKNVKVFHAGIQAWKKAGNIVVSNAANIEHLNKTEAPYILLDLRSKGNIEKGHIPKAVGAADGKVEALKSLFPSHKAAPIILYNQDGNLAKATEAYKTIAGWGYNQLSILQGGFEGWKKAGKEIAKGPAASEIKYVRKLMPGEMDVEVFKALLEKPSPDKIILDVRLASEVKDDGALPGSINIPLDVLESHLAELPKDKTLVLHCSTGVRAEMAYNILKKAGFKPEYVKANVEFDKEHKGKYKIAE